MEMINLMLHLAICDKSLNDIEQMEKYLENIKFFNFDYEVFENAKELYKYQTQHHENFDIYILSIELEDMLASAGKTRSCWKGTSRSTTPSSVSKRQR